MSNKYFLVFLAFLFSVSVYSQQGRHRSSLISGRVMSTEKEVVDFATVYLKGTNQGCYTDEKKYRLKKEKKPLRPCILQNCKMFLPLRGKCVSWLT